MIIKGLDNIKEHLKSLEDSRNERYKAEIMYYLRDSVHELKDTFFWSKS